MSTPSTRGKYAVFPKDRPRGEFKEEQNSLIQQGKKYFPKEYFPHWQAVCNKLSDAGYGAVIPLSYIRHSPKLVKLLNAEVAINLASVVSLAAIKVNRAAAEMLPKVAVIAARDIKSVAGFITWINVIEELVKLAPESVSCGLSTTW